MRISTPLPVEVFVEGLDSLWTELVNKLAMRSEKDQSAVVGVVVELNRLFKTQDFVKKSLFSLQFASAIFACRFSW